MENHLKVATFLANLLDNQFRLFGVRFGLNGVLGLIPGIGDIITAIMASYLIWIALQLGLPPAKVAQMVWNVVKNFLIGLLPLAGDYVDFFHHANLNNLHILQQHVADNPIVEGKVLSSSLAKS